MQKAGFSHDAVHMMPEHVTAIPCLPIQLLECRTNVSCVTDNPYSENKGADQLTAKLICVLVFAFAKSRFSHEPCHEKTSGICENKGADQLVGNPTGFLMIRLI